MFRSHSTVKTVKTQAAPEGAAGWAPSFRSAKLRLGRLGGLACLGGLRHGINGLCGSFGEL